MKFKLVCFLSVKEALGCPWLQDPVSHLPMLATKALSSTLFLAQMAQRAEMNKFINKDECEVLNPRIFCQMSCFTHLCCSQTLPFLRLLAPVVGCWAIKIDSATLVNSSLALVLTKKFLIYIYDINLTYVVLGFTILTDVCVGTKK